MDEPAFHAGGNAKTHSKFGIRDSNVQAVRPFSVISHNYSALSTMCRDGFDFSTIINSVSSLSKLLSNTKLMERDGFHQFEATPLHSQRLETTIYYQLSSQICLRRLCTSLFPFPFALASFSFRFPTSP